MYGLLDSQLFLMPQCGTSGLPWKIYIACHNGNFFAAKIELSFAVAVVTG
jgi:hypothetical protein